MDERTIGGGQHFASDRRGVHVCGGGLQLLIGDCWLPSALHPPPFTSTLTTHPISTSFGFTTRVRQMRRGAVVSGKQWRLPASSAPMAQCTLAMSGDRRWEIVRALDAPAGTKRVRGKQKITTATGVGGPFLSPHLTDQVWKGARTHKKSDGEARVKSSTLIVQTHCDGVSIAPSTNPLVVPPRDVNQWTC
ncbi:hypothetical protein TcWFU_004978 [Taenia crassiceps]|uniref:Uncharacterized protein n=1 Tax=Taenia crassiceps TaxID=6207 RepID=A0ABR4PZY2_9CEST